MDVLLSVCAGSCGALAVWLLLTVVLRAACYWAGVEVPALGRAMATALVGTGVSLPLGVLIQLHLTGGGYQRPNPILFLLALILGMSAGVAAAAAVYAPLLGVRFRQGLRVGAYQVLLLTGLLIVFGCVVFVGGNIFGTLVRVGRL